MSKLSLTEGDLAVLRGLRDAGCAVCVFMPDEVGDASLDDVEDAMCAAGWDTIQRTTCEVSHTSNEEGESK